MKVLEGNTKITLSLEPELCKRFREAYPDVKLDDFIMRNFRKAIGEAELRKFAAEQQAAANAEVQKEAQRLNEELGLA